MTTPKLVTCTVFACAVFTEIFCQVDSTCANGTSLFQNIYAGARNDFAYSLAPDADSGYVIVGYTNSFGHGGTDGLITKINKKGSVIWNKAAGGTGDDILYRVRKTGDGGFIACGQTKSFGNAAGDAWLVKLDASGITQWSRRYGDGNVYGDIAFDVTQLSDGGYAFAGTHRFAGGVADGLVVRTDSQGNVIWSKSYGNWNSDDANGIMEDGNFLIVTGLYYAATFYDSYVMKLDKSSGALQWIKGYDAENRSTWMYKVAKTNIGYQVLSVVTDNFVDQNQQQCIWNINTDGSLQNVRKLSIPGNWTSSYGWYPLADGGFIGSNGENNNSESDALVFRVNANGSLQFSKQLPMTGKQALWSATPAPDGGYVLAGYSTNAATIADSNNIYVVKIDSLGGSCSANNSSAVTVVNPSFTLPTPDVAPIGDLTMYSPVITVGIIDSLPNTNTVCNSCVSITPPPPSDTSCANGNSLFQKIYAGSRNDLAYNIAQATDGGYVIVGFTNSFGNGGSDGLITRINKNGSVVSNNAVGGTGDEVLYTVKPTSDGGFIAVGQTKSYGNAAGDAWLVKLDSAANIQWSKKYGDGNVYGDIGFNVTQLSDGGYAFAGSHRFSPGVADGFVVRTDAQGNAVWSKSYGNWNSDLASGIVEDGNSLLVVGYYYAATFYDSYVMKLDKSNGAVQWIKGFDAESRSTLMSKIAKINNGYQVVSVVTDNFNDQNQQECIWNINTDGSVQNVRKVAITGTWSVSWGWYPLADGGFIGSNGENNDQSDALVCRVNANGTLQFSKQYPVPGKQALLSITSSPEGGYAFAGYSTNAATIADSNNVCVMKIDSLGGSCSGSNTNEITIVNPSYALTTPDVAPVGDVTINNPIITVGVVSSTPITNTICQTCVSSVPDFTLPPDGSSTVNCPADAVQPTPPIVVDSCGNTLTPTVTVPSPVACNGTMAYVFRYTGCGGHTHDWTYTYTIAIPDFALPADISTTVNCTSWVTQVIPPTVIDACGNTIAPTLTAPAPVDCGTMPFVYTYTDCGGHSHVWTWTYIIDPPDFALPPDGFSTVSCPADVVQPTPPTIRDACGDTLTPIVTSPSPVACNGIMVYTFTYTDCAAHSHAWIYTYTVADNIAPTITCAGNKTIDCNAPVQFDQPNATDNCDSLPTIVVVSTSPDGLTRTWRATDACGNSATCSQTITVATCSAHLFPTATTCCNYVTGTAAQLQKVCYTKSGNSISKVVPGVFFYYSFVTAPSSGPFVITVEQLNNNASFQLFAIQNATQIRLTDMSCGTTSLAFTSSITGTNSSQAVLTVSSYTPGATYVVSVKYDAKSIISSTFVGTPTAAYTFRSKVNGVIAAGSTGTMNAQFGCQDNTPTPSNNCQLTTIALPASEQMNSEPTVRAYPNPFTDIVNFQISANVPGKVTLEVYNLQGQKLGIAFQGWMEAGEVRIVQYKSRIASGGLIYQLSISDKKLAGKVFSLK